MPRKWWALATVGCGTFMATLDSSIVNIALPTLRKALATDLRSIKWVIVVYLLTITCSLLPFGRLSDLYGRKRVFQAGFIVFTLGSLLCGFSENLSHLIGARIFQGLGASMLMANGPAIITAAFERSSRGKALGALSMIVSLGLVSGPWIGGFLITFFDQTLGPDLSWRSIFLVNLPIGMIGVSLAQLFLTNARRRQNPGPFDWGGALIQILVLLSFILFVDPPPFSVGGARPIMIPRAVLGGIFVAVSWVFYVVQKQVPEPILDFSLFRIRTFWSANLANFLNFLAYSSLLVLMPFYLEEVMNFSPRQAGQLMGIIPLTVFFVAFASGWLSDRVGIRILTVSGTTVSAITLLMMGGAFGPGLAANSSYLFISLLLSMIGMGSGLFQSPNNVAVMSSIPHDKLGVASALIATIRNLGLVTGTGIAAKIFSWKHAESGDFVLALHQALLIAGALAAAAMIASLTKSEEDAPQEATDGVV